MMDAEIPEHSDIARLNGDGINIPYEQEHGGLVRRRVLPSLGELMILRIPYTCYFCTFANFGHNPYLIGYY